MSFYDEDDDLLEHGGKWSEEAKQRVKEARKMGISLVEQKKREIQRRLAERKLKSRLNKAKLERMKRQAGRFFNNTGKTLGKLGKEAGKTYNKAKKGINNFVEGVKRAERSALFKARIAYDGSRYNKKDRKKVSKVSKKWKKDVAKVDKRMRLAKDPVEKTKLRALRDRVDERGKDHVVKTNTKQWKKSWGQMASGIADYHIKEGQKFAKKASKEIGKFAKSADRVATKGLNKAAHFLDGLHESKYERKIAAERVASNQAYANRKMKKDIEKAEKKRKSKKNLGTSLKDAFDIVSKNGISADSISKAGNRIKNRDKAGDKAYNKAVKKAEKKRDKYMDDVRKQVKKDLNPENRYKSLGDFFNSTKNIAKREGKKAIDKGIKEAKKKISDVQSEYEWNKIQSKRKNDRKESAHINGAYTTVRKKSDGSVSTYTTGMRGGQRVGSGKPGSSTPSIKGVENMLLDRINEKERKEKEAFKKRRRQHKGLE